MSLFDRMFGTRSAAQAPAKPQGREAIDRNATRRELLRVALRDTLVRHGVPTEWIGVETMSAAMKGREPGIHMRLVLRHWEPRLVNCAVALQNSVAQRVMLFDPLAAGWLMGISWQFAPADESRCPPMPDPSEWKSAASAAPAPAPSADRKALLDRMFARQPAPQDDEDEHPEFSATQPMTSTLPPAEPRRR